MAFVHWINITAGAWFKSYHKTSSTRLGNLCSRKIRTLSIFMESNQQHKAAMDDVTKKGHFVRQDSKFRYWISKEKTAQFVAEPNRYHLYVSLACPWAHRTLIVRKLKGLEHIIGCTVVHYHMDSLGWRFVDSKEEVPFCTPDEINGAKRLREIYFQANPGYDGRFTVPLLWDKKTKTIVNNESADIIRMLNSEFNEFAKYPDWDFYPLYLASRIDSINSVVYEKVNNGVYKAGFARTQEAYEEAVTELFQQLENLEQILSKSRYLCGNQVTEADIRLFTTLIRFDTVYQYHFKCNLRPLYSFPNLQGFTLDMYQLPGVKETVSFEHIKKHYYTSHPTINPFAIVPVGPKLDFSVPHHRDTQFA